ncbi:DUF664 domain-containing protein [Xanthocytophaga agilis]|uniref:DinB family protein n=1 Tax=Xanthocytophaga agilis TaxID=3048010 RepID=A0AAE3R8E7_9BACT|nr:DUF664 domain-containing protein [Xanthocytophaga agilis]MDJ1503299.1 DinB family protein [Xanthocytophaga agilis]
MPPDGCYTPCIGNLVSLLRYSRYSTLTCIHALTQYELDFYIDSKANSIGILLRHIAALETLFQCVVFEVRDLTPNEKEFWKGSLSGELYLRLVNGHELNYYINILEQTRNKTYESLKYKDDQWLFSETRYPFGSPVNNYYCLFHIMEDELNHLGQIKMIKERIM